MMSQYKTKKNGISSSVCARLVVLMTTVCLVGALSTGCERDVTVTGDNQSSENGSNDNQENNDNNNNNTESPYDDEYLEHHGPDEDEELTEAGVLQGSWRAAFVEGDVPLVYFDLFHDDGESSADGDFLMGMAISNMQDGTTGEISEVTIDGDDLEFQWNPTDSSEEMYILNLSGEDADTYTGTFSAVQYPETHEVSVTRQVFED